MVTCRVLTAPEVLKYGDFLKDRTLETKNLYFGISVSDYYIDQLLERIQDNPSKHRIVVAEDVFLNIVGTIHIADMSDEEVELGVMVAEDYRKLGISSTMMDYALTWCRNRNKNKIYMHCLGHNKPIIHLVKKYGLAITRDHGDADAHVTLPHGDIVSWQHEAVLRQTATIATITRTGLNTFRRMLSLQ